MLTPIYDFIAYLKKPFLPNSEEKNRITNKAFFILLVFIICLALISIVISDNKWLLDFLKIDEEFKLKKDIFKFGYWLSILLVCIVGPCFEELIFRLYLNSTIANNTFLPINICIIVTILFNLDGKFETGVIIIFIAYSIFLLQLLSNNKKAFNDFKIFLNQHFNIYFYLSAFSFAIVHITNYTIHHFVPVFPVLLVLPQIILGLILGYIRILKGIQWSMLFHGIFNFVLISLLFFGK